MEYLLLPSQVAADAAAASLVGFGGACSKGGHVTVALGVAGLNLFFGITLFLFSAPSLFLTLGLVSGSGSLNWLAGAGIIGPILFSSSKNAFIFLTMFGCGQSCVGSWYVPNQLGRPVPPENVFLT